MIPVAVVIPVYNAPEELRLCIDALSRNTTYPATVLLIDDASSDPAIPPLLEDAKELEGFRVLRNTVNLGFSATVNRGLRSAAGLDVVILNSDTEVTPGWLERLVASAYSDPLIATVTPVSDNAGAFSVPEIGIHSEVPSFLDFDAAGRVVAHASQRVRPRTPTGNGFCMFVKRIVLDEIGELDAEAFPRGYGEENDFCMRALGRGWSHVVDDGVFVHHVREASFGTSKEELMAQGRAIVDERHPQYTPLVREFVRSADMATVRTTVAEAYAEAGQTYAEGAEVRPGVLFVAHEGTGGTPATNLDLMAALEDEYDPWLLTSTGRELRLDRMVGGKRQPIERRKLTDVVSPLDFSRIDYRAAVAEILDRHAIELIHVRHLFKHTFDLPDVAASRGIPVVFSFHDYYFTCPTVHLLDDQLRFCGGICTPGFGHCRIPSGALQGLPPLKHQFVHQWREEVLRALANVDAFVTTSHQARAVHLAALPELVDRPFEIIEHGRDLTQGKLAVSPSPGRKVRIAVPASLDLHKGAQLMREILEHDSSGRIEFHLLGEVPEQYADLGKAHGRYERDELESVLAGIRPAFVGIFSIWAETYSHVLSEAWGAGIPVIATALGAPRERVQQHGGGWLIAPDDPVAAVRLILAVADDRAEYERGAATAAASNVRTIAQMAGDYSALYRRVIDGRRALAAPRSSRRWRHLSRGVLRAEMLVPARGPEQPRSTQVRLLRRYLHPSFRTKIHVSVRAVDDFASIPAARDLVIAQLEAIPHERIEEISALIAERELPLVLDLGHQVDRVLDPPDRPSLLSAASMVTVATPAAARLLTERGVPTVLVPDAIDERLFFAADGQPATQPVERPVRAVTIDPGENLAMLERALKLARRKGARVELITIDGGTAYPDHVRFLRSERGAWDFGLAPLDGAAGGSTRSDLSYLEFAALGLPAVFSRGEPFACVTDGTTGLLADGEDAWCDAILRLAEDPELRETIGRQAQAEIKRSRLIRHGAGALLAALSGLVEEGPSSVGLQPHSRSELALY